MSEKLDRAQAIVSQHMDAILRCFLPGARITVLVRNPSGERELGAHDFILTDDELPEAAKIIERRLASSHQRTVAHIALQPPPNEDMP